jgi:hypothetical protein
MAAKQNSEDQNRKNNGKRGKDDVRERKSKNLAPTDHHIVPSSRMHEPEYQEYIGKSNLTIVPDYPHHDYHHLFFNLTPPEIIAKLVTDFWGGQVFWIQKYLEDPEHFLATMREAEKSQFKKHPR